MIWNHLLELLRASRTRPSVTFKLVRLAAVSTRILVRSTPSWAVGVASTKGSARSRGWIDAASVP
jgi:hypothetical protein